MNIVFRSQQHVMIGKSILVIGGGAYSKKNIWPDSTMYGIKVRVDGRVKGNQAIPFASAFIAFIFYMQLSSLR